jgi:hypothetical protein
LIPDPALDPAIFVSDFQEANKEYFYYNFFAYCFLYCRYIFQPPKIKSQKEVTKQQKSGVFYKFLLVDGSIRIWSRVRKNNYGYGFRRPKTYEYHGSGSGTLTATLLHGGLIASIKE